jgi:hypothetical protein
MIDAPIQLLCSLGLRLRKRCCRFAYRRLVIPTTIGFC